MTRASAVLDRNVLVRLVGYRNGTEGAAAGFLQTCSSVARARRPSGLVYRDLARQVPDWNARITREIQEPNPFQFLDYAVPLPDAGVPAVEDPSADGYEQLAAIYEVPFRLFAEADVNPRFTFYNLFEVIGPPQMSSDL